MDGHRKRLGWQIHRIYRARNQLVHSGKVPTYLDSLIMNIFEYYRSSISTIVQVAKTERRRSDIDQIVAEIGINYEVMRQNFPAHSREKAITERELLTLVNRD